MDDRTTPNVKTKLLVADCRYSDVRSLITCMHTQAKTQELQTPPQQQQEQQEEEEEEEERKHFISAWRLSLLCSCSSRSFSSHHLHILIKTILISLRRRRRRRRRRRCHMLASTELNDNTTFPKDSPHLSEQTPPPRERAAASSCVYITHHLPASTNQEPEQGGRLGKHIVTGVDLYVGQWAGGDRGAESGGGAQGGPGGGRGALCRAVITTRGIPEWGLAGRQSKGHTHTHTNTNNTILIWGL
ncbi:unnamed protein product [Pleuronectes platessa]|uniref:Uncharacterized protein n=1 Tax=Pleuronectes platessa TaxID=8262 RepID=A0A9N7Y811_PLEPL|nr:unnamed protein product [Pleuronectes platessa]